MSRKRKGSLAYNIIKYGFFIGVGEFVCSSAKRFFITIGCTILVPAMIYNLFIKNKLFPSITNSTNEISYTQTGGVNSAGSNYVPSNSNIMYIDPYELNPIGVIEGLFISDEQKARRLDIQADYGRAKERAQFALENLGIIKYSDFQLGTQFIDVDKLNRTRFIIKDDKTLLEAWIMGEVLKDINPTIAANYYKNIVYIPLNGSDNSIPHEYKFSSKADFAELLGVSANDGRDINNIIDGTFYALINQKNGYVFATEIETNILGTNKTNSKPYSYRYNNEDRSSSLSTIIREQKKEQASNMKKLVLGPKYNRYC